MEDDTSKQLPLREQSVLSTDVADIYVSVVISSPPDTSINDEQRIILQGLVELIAKSAAVMFE